MRLLLLLSGVVSTVATNDRSKKVVSHRRFFPIAGALLSDDFTPPTRDWKLLRGSTLDLPLAPEIAGDFHALPLTGMVVPLDEMQSDAPEDSVQLGAAPVGLDGPLQDLFDFGNVIGAAVLPRAAHGRPLELPMDILHVKMQQEVPKPLTVDDTPSNVHIYGTLPKNLTAKTLQVSSEGRDLLVKYFMDEGKAGSSVIGIDERFTLDFEPREAPIVKYKASTGVFELTLPRPPKESVGQQVNINFEDVATPEVAPKKVAEAVAPRPAAAAAPNFEKASEELKMAIVEHNGESTRKRVEDIANEFAEHFSHTPASHESNVSVDDGKTLAKMTKQLREAGHAQKLASGRDDQTKRAKEIADKAKRFVAEARLGDARTELQDAFAPQIFEGEGMVLLELNHKSL
jgi:hypothetical protein